jgi:16S rRNA (cytosine1402-N4)-methyltransferase
MIFLSGIYVDCTYGRGGHSREILKRLNDDGLLIVMDRDPLAVESAMKEFANDKRVVISKSTFSLLLEIIERQNLTGKVNGVLLDLGVSSPQLDDSRHGFSFKHDGDLDMRMDPESGMNAAEWINTAKEEDIANVLYEYGEERYSRRVARAIIKSRSESPITRTLQLAAIIKNAIPRWEKNKDPATRSFQAIRIYINNELDELNKLLEDIYLVLGPRGKLVVISFHSLEDRIVKRFFSQQSKGDDYPPEIPVTYAELKPKFKTLGKAKKPDELEVDANPRARSAILRAGEKIAA